MTRPRPALLVLGAGALALAAGTVGIAWAGSGMHVESVGARPAAQATSTSPAPQGVTATAPSTQETGTAYRSLERRDATELPRPDRTPRPVELSIPAIDVRVAVEPEQLSLKVSNPIADLAPRDESGSGLGLVGIQERVGLLGGTVQHGARDGRFTLSAHLPLRPGRETGA